MRETRKLLQKVVNSVPFHSSHERLKEEIKIELEKSEVGHVHSLKRCISCGGVSRFDPVRLIQRLTDEEVKRIITARTYFGDSDLSIARYIMDAMIEKNK